MITLLICLVAVNFIVIEALCCAAGQADRQIEQFEPSEFEPFE